MGCARNVDHRPSVCTFSIAYLCNSCQVHSICSKLHFFKDLPLNIQQELQYVCCKIDTQSFDRSIVLHILHCVGFHSHIYVYIYICYIYTWIYNVFTCVHLIQMLSSCLQKNCGLTAWPFVRPVWDPPGLHKGRVLFCCEICMMGWHTLDDGRNPAQKPVEVGSFFALYIQ